EPAPESCAFPPLRYRTPPIIRRESPLPLLKTSSTGTGYIHRDGTAPPALSRMCPTVLGNGPRPPASDQRTGPLHPTQGSWSSTVNPGNFLSRCRCCPADSAPPGASS